MNSVHRKVCISTSLVLLIINVTYCKHLLHSGMATGRMVNMQDSVIESCRGHFMCKVFPFEQSLGLTCLHAQYVCDGIQHCENGEDEYASECGGKGGHGGSGIVVYDSHSNNQGEEFPFDQRGEYSHGQGDNKHHTGDGHHEGQKGGNGGSKSGSNRQIIILQQPPAPAPTPKKHRTVIGPPQAVPVPVLPRPGFLPRAPPILPPPAPPLISPYAGLGGFGYGGLGGLGRFGGLGGLGGFGGMSPLGALALREALD